MFLVDKLMLVYEDFFFHADIMLIGKFCRLLHSGVSSPKNLDAKKMLAFYTVFKLL